MINSFMYNNRVYNCVTWETYQHIFLHLSVCQMEVPRLHTDKWFAGNTYSLDTSFIKFKRKHTINNWLDP